MTCWQFIFCCSLPIPRFYDFAFKKYFSILVYDGSMLLKSLLWNRASHHWGQQKTVNPKQADSPKCAGWWHWWQWLLLWGEVGPRSCLV